jgi:hypothetical protein
MGHILMIRRKLHGKIVERVVLHVLKGMNCFWEKRKREREGGV